MESLAQREKNEKRIIFIIDILIVASIIAIGAICFAKRPAVTDSGRDGEYSRQYGAVGELITAVNNRLIHIENGLNGIEANIRRDEGGIRNLAEQVREIAGEVKVLEEYVLDTRRDLGVFLDWYYSALDNEIEQELGIRIPK